MEYWIYLLILSGSTYLIRAVPFALMRKKITNRFLRSFLYYVPYAVLTAMTVPAIFYSTNPPVTAAAGTLVAAVLAYFRQPLIVVALAASATALGMGFLL